MSGHDEHEHDEHGHDHDDHGDHEHHRHDLETLGVGVVTVSTSRDPDEDPSGDLVVELFEDANHEIAARDLVPDDHDLIQGTVNDLVDREPVDVVVTTGGTGVTPDDVTPEAVEALIDKPLPGFGELFRQLSYEEIGTMVVATRAVGGIIEDVPVFTLPGSTNAVRLGVEEIILPEVGHLAGLARRDDETDP
jgi:molybdenum cofactor biosynthesis protein B